MKTENKIFPKVSEAMTSTLSEEPIFLDGMEVQFDKKVGLYPVKLTKAIRSKKTVNGNGRRSKYIYR